MGKLALARSPGSRSESANMPAQGPSLSDAMGARKLSQFPASADATGVLEIGGNAPVSRVGANEVQPGHRCPTSAQFEGLSNRAQMAVRGLSNGRFPPLRRTTRAARRFWPTPACPVSRPSKLTTTLDSQTRRHSATRGPENARFPQENPCLPVKSHQSPLLQHLVSTYKGRIGLGTFEGNRGTKLCPASINRSVR